MKFDVVVVGAGPVGLAAACALRGRSVALVAHEAPRLGDRPASMDARVYALSPGNVAFLRSLGAWQLLDPARIAAIRTMRVHGDRGSCIELDAYRAGAPELAWTVEDGELQRALWRALESHASVRVLAPAQCQAIEHSSESARLRLRDGTDIDAALLVGADGAGSFVRIQAGIAAATREYGQVALVANFSCAKDHGGVAYQWFQQGPVLALLPLPGRCVSMIWSLPAEEASRLVALDDGALAREATEASRGIVGSLQPLTAARSYPLRHLRAARLIASRTVLVGDAAHVVHPLAGQGLNLGLQDVRALAEVLARQPVSDPGDERLLRRYERQRAEPILAANVAIEGLFRLFGAEGRGFATLRNLGLNLTDRLPVVKNLLIREAMR
ncbi:MAG: FAD-dependent monooxygenase [Betaproteobacteria bacterium]|nr:FAD-dependent monooxygenase [Betaproteobacteria bacterium]